MTNSPKKPKLLAIDHDARLAYLLQRYTEQRDCELITITHVPALDELIQFHPQAIIFPSIESLQSAQALLNELLTREIFVVACVSAADEATAREIGVDICLFHPLTYEDFWAALSPLCVSVQD